MINLNLLSPKQKEALDARVVYALLERFMILVVGSALMITVVLLGVSIELTKRLSDIQGRQLLSSQYLSVNKETSRVNVAVARMDDIEAHYAPVTQTIFDIFKRVTPGIRLDAIGYNKTGELPLAGHADTRDHLLAFTESLRGSPFVVNVNNPIANLFQKTDINFSLSVTVRVPDAPKAPATKPTTPKP